MPETPDDPTAQILLAFAPRFTHLIRQRLRRLEPPMTYRQYRLMRHIGDGATSLTALRERSVISLSTLSETVDGLVRKGLVTRMPSERDRRGIDLGLSELGREALGRAGSALESLGTDMLSEVPPDTRDALHRSLIAMHGAVQERLLSEDPRSPAPGGS